MRPSAIIIVVIAIGACATGAWLFLARGPSAPTQDETRAGNFFKLPQDYKTSGGQPMKPRW